MPMQPLPGPEAKEDGEAKFQSERPLDERKLDYIHSTPGAQPRTQSSVRIFICALVFETCFVIVTYLRIGRSINLYRNYSRVTDYETIPPIVLSFYIRILLNGVVLMGHLARPHSTRAHVHAPMQSRSTGTS